MRWAIAIMQPTPSLNTWQRAHRFERPRIVRDWQWRIKLAILQLPAGIPPAAGRRRVTITRYGRNLLDRDNLVGGAKPVIDALKALRLIVDDREALLDLVVAQERARGEVPPHTALVIEEFL